MISNTEILARLVLAAVFSGLVGLEREMRRRGAGLRTHILVCLGSTLLMLTGIYLFEHYKDVTTVDPGRIAAQVVSGIGFLGAGTIMQSRGTVKGLTTAASLWIVAGIGLAVGCGFYSGAVIATGISLVVLYLFSSIEREFVRSNGGWKE